MARLRNTKSGAVISVSKDRLPEYDGDVWERHDGGPALPSKSAKKPAAKKAPAKKAAAKTPPVDAGDDGPELVEP